MNSIKLPSPSNNNTIQDFEKDFLLSTGGDNTNIVQPVPYQESTVTTTLSTSQTQTWKNLFPFPKNDSKDKIKYIKYYIKNYPRKTGTMSDMSTRQIRFSKDTL